MLSNSDGAQQQSPHSSQRRHPCVPCQQRKVKCDRNEPCAGCKKSRIECLSASSLPPRRRKRRFPEAELLARLRRYEHHLKGYGADIDAINREGEPLLPTSTNVKSNRSGSPENFHPRSPGPIVRSLSVRRSLKHVENNLNIGISDEFRDAEEILQGSSEDEMFANPVTKTFEQLGGEGPDVLFGSPNSENFKSLHPSPVHIFRLWQTFLDNINPIIKIFHAPTVQQKVLDATADLDNIHKNTEALMFGIYCAATNSMTSEDCQRLFNDGKDAILARFQTGAQQALRVAGYLRSSDIVVLQAFTLYLLSSQQTTIDPRSLFCLTGVAIRIAQRMGLSTDGTNYGLPPFEVEMRRRLWWQIILIDIRVSELSGAGKSIVNYTWNTKLPANINDSDLFPDMRDPPLERAGLTEMIFVRLRCEFIQLIQQSKVFSGNLTMKDEVIKEFEQRIGREYLNLCDPLIPLHLMSTMMARSLVCKLGMVVRYPTFLSDRNCLSSAEKENIFQQSLQMLECHNAVMNNPSLKHYTWHIHSYFPFPAYTYLLCALRYRTNDELADRAWQELSICTEARMKHDDAQFFAKKKESLIHIALGNLTIKAWEAREAACQDSSQDFPVPRFISRYRKQLAEWKAKNVTTRKNLEPQAQEVLFGAQPVNQFPMMDSSSMVINEAFDPSMLAAFPSDLPSTGWDFWNGMIPSSSSMQGIDSIPPPYDYYQN